MGGGAYLRAGVHAYIKYLYLHMYLPTYHHTRMYMVACVGSLSTAAVLHLQHAALAFRVFTYEGTQETQGQEYIHLRYVLY